MDSALIFMATLPLIRTAILEAVRSQTWQVRCLMLILVLKIRS